MSCTRRAQSPRLFDAATIKLFMLAVAVSFSGCGFSRVHDVHPQEANVVSIDPQNWYVYYSSGMPPHPSADIEGEWSLELPNSGTGGHVNYVQTPFNAANPPQDVTITFRVDSTTPEYAVSDPGDKLPATVRLFFEQQGDDLQDPNGRWWANASTYNFGSNDGTTITFTIPFTSDQWTNVDGQHDPQAFADALNNIGWVGMTFGGQYFAGHGVALNGGSAKYVLINYRID
jgi:hypothetical protein